MRVPCYGKRKCVIIFSLVLFVIYRILISQFGHSVLTLNDLNRIILSRKSEKKQATKYILQWTSPTNVPFVYMGTGREGFIKRNCPYTNCIVTSNKSYLSDVTKFDVIAFAGPELRRLRKFPEKRSPHQKYVFASIESSHNYPLIAERFNGYFNWTWTYRLESEIVWGYMVIKNKNNSIIGPRKEMNWIKLDNMEPISEEYVKKISNKTKAAAWFVSNCNTKSFRMDYVSLLQAELDQFNLTIDIYGKCGAFECPRGTKHCNELIRDKYYFYLSFENSFSEDYVTEKLLNALQNDAVPIVLGGANYTRFMPDGIYLNAYQLGPHKLALKMNALIDDPIEYYKYFKWKNHYSYHTMDESVYTNPYCLFCAILHNESMVKQTTVYEDFLNWWNPNSKFLFLNRN